MSSQHAKNWSDQNFFVRYLAQTQEGNEKMRILLRFRNSCFLGKAEWKEKAYWRWKIYQFRLKKYKYEGVFLKSQTSTSFSFPFIDFGNCSSHLNSSSRILIPKFLSFCHLQIKFIKAKQIIITISIFRRSKAKEQCAY